MALGALVRAPGFESLPVVPISRIRAISHACNPRVKEEDVLLLAAFAGDEMTGYLGVLADDIYDAEGRPYHCGWLSCMWVNPELRGKGIARQLLAAAFESWGGNILVTEFTPEAKALYDRSGQFDNLCSSEGLRCYLRFNLHEVLPKKSHRYLAIEPMLKLADAIANLPADLRLLFLKQTELSGITFEETDVIDQELSHLICTYHKTGFERRNAAELNWILHYPWLRESGPDEESRKYHFSVVAKRFRNLCYKIKKNGELKGFLFLSVRDNHLKIPYAYFEEEFTVQVLQQIYALMRSFHLNMLTVYQPRLVSYLKTHQHPFLYLRTLNRNYIISKALSAHFSDKGSLSIQDGDADCAFT